MFITEEDYKVVIGDTALKVLSQTSESNRQNAEAEAIEEISGYLRPKYDCQAIFSAEGEYRNKQIVMYTCDIALYHMVSSTSARMGAETREKRYEQAIKWLEKVQAGSVTPDLPLAEDEDGQQTGQKLHWGSAKRLKNIW
ncbi:MAG: DUF1320 domain-containing protein [Bacteroidales bacterium]|jgi:phage gp36-like protein|nr:DUF1320 domain-containing protein [Bacteroidales bacterium]